MDVNYFGIAGVSGRLRFGKGGPVLDASGEDGFVAKSADGLTLVSIQGAQGTGPNDYVTYAQLQAAGIDGGNGSVSWGNIEDVPAHFASTIALVDGLTAALDGKAATTHGHSTATGEASGFMAPSMVLKLDSIEANATANATDAYLMSRGNHTGEQAISTVTGLQSALDGKAASAHGHNVATPTLDGFMAAVDKTKLDDIAVSATSNDTDANLRNRATHTGEQAISSVTGLQSALDAKSATSHSHSSASTTQSGFMSASDKEKLDGVAVNATENDTDENLRSRATHTGTQAISTVSGLQAALDGKFNTTGGALTGNVSMAIPAGDATFVIGGLAETSRSVLFKTGANNRFAVMVNAAAENGNNLGSDLELVRYDDSGNILGSAIVVSRDTGVANFSAVPTVMGTSLVTTANALVIGTSATTAAAGNHTHGNATSSQAGFMSVDDKNKLDGISNNATANSPDATLTNRANHTGEQAISTVAGLQTALDGKAAAAHTHSAADVDRGTFDIARIPNIPTSKVVGEFDAANLTGTIDPARLPVFMTGDVNRVTAETIAGLTPAQQAEIVNGTIVTTTDGYRWTYLTGTKTDESSYVQMADITPEWEVIANRPSIFPTNTSNVSGLQAALDAKSDATHTHDNATNLLAGFMSPADKSKLDGLAVGATANSTDAFLLDRVNHTGSQAISTVTGLQAALTNNADAAQRVQSMVNHAVSGETVGTAPLLYTPTIYGDPNSTTDIVVDGTVVTTQTDAAEGTVLRVAGTSQVVALRKWYPIGQNKTHRVTVRVRVVTNHAVNANSTMVGFGFTNSAGTNSGLWKNSSTHASADGWITVSTERTSAEMRAIAPTATHFRPLAEIGLNALSETVSGATVEVAYVTYEDVTTATTILAGLMSPTDKTKLNGLAAGATANSTDAFLLDRGNHTGSQAISTVTGLQAALDGKASSSHTHNYLPLSGGSLTGNLMMNATASERNMGFTLSNGTVYFYGSDAQVGLRDGINAINPLVWDTSTKQLTFDVSATGSINFAQRPTFGGNAAWDAGNFDPNLFVPQTMPVGGYTIQTLVGRNLRIQSANTNGGVVDIGTGIANASGSIFFRDSAGTRRGYITVLDSGTMQIVADSGVDNITMTRRPTFNGNLAWDAGNFTPANYLPLAGGTMTGTLVVNTLNGGSTGITVNGSGEFNIGGSGGLRVGGNKIRFGTTASTEGFTFASNIMYLENNRSMSIGSGGLTAGSGTFSGTVVASDVTQSSDERLKEQWSEMWPEGFSLQLPNVLHGKYVWKANQEEDFGVGAQSLEQLLHMATHMDETGFLSVKYAKVALMAVIDLAKQVNKINDKLAMMEGE